MVINSRAFSSHPFAFRQRGVDTDREAQRLVRDVRQEGVDFIKASRRLSRQVFFALADEVKSYSRQRRDVSVRDARNTSLWHGLFNSNFIPATF
jgi:hypothetical protein